MKKISRLYKTGCLLIVLFVLFPAIDLFAGYHMAICEKANLADDIVEVSFKVIGHYPEKEHLKKWSPPEAGLNVIAKTGKIIKVFKGDLKIGEGWEDRFGMPFKKGEGRDPVRWWEDFFKRPGFSQIVFLTKEANSYSTVSGAEESAGCEASPHFSWCKGYKNFKAEVEKCLKLKIKPASRKSNKRYGCDADKDCVLSCSMGALNLDWYKGNLKENDCVDGCAGPGLNVRCVNNTCIAFDYDGSRADDCTMRE